MLVLDQHEDDAACGLRALAGDDEAGDRDAARRGGASRARVLVATPSRRGRRIASAWSSSVTAAGRVVGEQLLPAPELAQRRRLRALERERELDAAGDAAAGDRHAEVPQRPAALARERVAGPRPGELLERGARRGDARRELGDACERPALRARAHERRDLLGAHPAHVAEADPDRAAGLDRALGERGVDVDGAQRDAAPLGLVGERVGRVEAHRLLVEQRAQELGAVVHAQPGRLVGEQAEGGAVRLGEAEAGEAGDHLPHPPGERLARADVGGGALDEAAAVALDRDARALAAHRAAQPVGLAGAEAGEGLRDLEHLVLEDDRAERLAQHAGERGVQARRLVVGVLAQALAALDVGVDGAALDRARPDDRHLHRQLREVLGAGAPQRLHLRAALDLEDAGRLGALDRREGGGIVEGDPREVDPLAARERDQLDRALDRREHPQAEQVDLEEAGVGAGVLVPLDELAALHRRRHHRAAVDQRPRRDDHPAGVLGDVAREPERLLREPCQPGPAARARARAQARSRDRHRPRGRSCRRRARRARSRPAAARAPCPARGSRRACGSSGRSRRARRGRGRSARGRGGSGPRAHRAGSRCRCRAARSAPGSGSGPSRGRRRAGRCARGRSGSRRSRRPRSRGRGRAAAARAPSPAPRTSAATSRESSRISWWSRKKPASESVSITASSCSRRAAASRRAMPAVALAQALGAELGQAALRGCSPRRPDSGSRGRR